MTRVSRASDKGRWFRVFYRRTSLAFFLPHDDSPDGTQGHCVTKHGPWQESKPDGGAALAHKEAELRLPGWGLSPAPQAHQHRVLTAEPCPH